jgi:hypothetical protein
VGGKRREDYIMGRKVEVPIEHGTRFIIAPLLDSLVTCVGKDGKPNII